MTWHQNPVLKSGILLANATLWWTPVSIHAAWPVFYTKQNSGKVLHSYLASRNSGKPAERTYTFKTHENTKCNSSKNLTFSCLNKVECYWMYEKTWQKFLNETLTRQTIGRNFNVLVQKRMHSDATEYCTVDQPFTWIFFIGKSKAEDSSENLDIYYVQ